jgi:hypothetical protein
MRVFHRIDSIHGDYDTNQLVGLLDGNFLQSTDLFITP